MLGLYLFELRDGFFQVYGGARNHEDVTSVSMGLCTSEESMNPPILHLKGRPVCSNSLHDPMEERLGRTYWQQALKVTNSKSMCKLDIIISESKRGPKRSFLTYILREALEVYAIYRQ